MTTAATPYPFLRLLPIQRSAYTGKIKAHSGGVLKIQSFRRLYLAGAGNSQPFNRRSVALFRSTVPISTITFQRVTSSPSPPPPLSSLPADRPLPQSLRQIVQLFQSVPEPRVKYQQLLFYGKKLPPLREELKTPANKVQGCVSQVWVHAFLDSDGTVRFEADSDTDLTRGLAALLVKGLSGLPPLEIAAVSPDFIQLTGLGQSLTPSRNNGFLNLLLLMQKKALELAASHDSEAGLDDKDSSFAEIDSNSDQSVAESSTDVVDGGENGVVDGDVAKGIEEERSYTEEKMEEKVVGDRLSSRKTRIQERLMSELSPVELEVADISDQHAGHAAVRGSGDGETHFVVRVVSAAFEGKSLVKRHRLIYQLLEDELQSGLHALSITAETPNERKEAVTR